MRIFPWKDDFLRIMLIVLVLLFLALIALSAQPASAQTPWQTPTPIPAVATAQGAANTAQAAAQSSRNEAAQLEARAAEIRRNAAAQDAAAAQAIADARAAAAAQNASAIGEAIGRAEGNLSQLKASVDGQAALIATLQARNADRDTQIGILRTQLQNTSAALLQAQTAQQKAQGDYNALKQYQADHANDSAIAGIPWLFAFIVFCVLGIALLLFVLTHQRQPRNDPQKYKSNDDQSEEAIEGEVIKHDDNHGL